MPPSPPDSKQLLSEISVAQFRLAEAKEALKSAKDESRLAKRRRREAKEVARRAKKVLKKAKTALAEAERAVAELETRLTKPRLVKGGPSEATKGRKPKARQKTPKTAAAKVSKERSVVGEDTRAPESKELTDLTASSGDTPGRSASAQPDGGERPVNGIDPDNSASI
jgi:hypothetical protein